MRGTELRRRYLEFFESKGALRIDSDSLVPNDPTLMFTSAGMVQFKPYFLGLQNPPATRATTAQKCLRTTDIEDVGDTSHCTFFEMLGNFSFGDYFKTDVIPWAWEFLFDVLKLDLKRVRVTIFETDEEAFTLWRNAGMPENKIFRFGEESNYWFAGPTGPCGPDSEIFYDTQPHLPPTPDGEWDDKRWLEIWNLVFMQFDRSEDGTLTPLPKKNIDTGMGLERTAAVLANLRGPFETDLFAPIMRQLEEITGLRYGATDDGATDVAFRRVADHVRATAFCLADGVLPANTGRGYVLRRIMRRAILAGTTTLGLTEAFLDKVLPTVIEHRKDEYPELERNAASILRSASIEEKQFRRTLSSGSVRLTAILDSDIANQTKIVTGEDAFSLFATYGFPIELTIELANNRGFEVDRASFAVLLDEHAKISEGASSRFLASESLVPALRSAGVGATTFVGYAETSGTSEILAIVRDGALVSQAAEGDVVQLVVDMSPFYAESGGQIGDTGGIDSENASIKVIDTQKDSGYWFHTANVEAGELKLGDKVRCIVDQDRRTSIERNHTMTHVLHKALQMVLGDHVQQKGSLVTADRLRFDFSHQSSMTQSEIRQVEAIVNEKILEDIPISILEKPIDEARDMGAMMLFGEKYGSIVRVVTAGDFSVEFCGGTHLRHTSQAGFFKLVSEASSQAGVRRVEAVTGRHALMRTLDHERILSDAAASLKTSPQNLMPAVERLLTQIKEKDAQLQLLVKASSSQVADKLIQAAVVIGTARIVTGLVDASGADGLRNLCADILNKVKSGIVILASVTEEKVAFAVKVSNDIVERGYHAGEIANAAATAAGGRGGGKADFAQAGGKDPALAEQALDAAMQYAKDIVPR